MEGEGMKDVRLRKKQIIEVLVICVLFLAMAWYVESTDRKLDEQNRILRGEPGDGTDHVELELDIEGIVDQYPYSLEVDEQRLTWKEATVQFDKAKEEIEASFYSEGEDSNHVTQNVCMKETYVGGLVEADWMLDNYSVVDIDGQIHAEESEKEGIPVQATVELSLGKYEENYSFYFRVFAREKSAEETLLQHVQEAINLEQEKEGSTYLHLPEQVDGYTVSWGQAREHLVFKVLFLEIVIVILLRFVLLERAREQERLRREEMMLDYAEVVNKLLILLGSGMTLKQAWNRIAARYSDKRDKIKLPKRHIYEEMLTTAHEIQDGESERISYQKFGERTGLGAYQRLVRILVQNVQTGSRGLCQLLEQEAETALEERRAMARKLGEEAGTKMLLPLILMLGIVIAIIMVPAIQSFNA